MKKRDPVVRCRECGFLVRGENHKNGAHHKQGQNRKYSPPKRSRR